jgi:hypothetical protein
MAREVLLQGGAVGREPPSRDGQACALAVAAGRAHAHAEWRRYLPDFLVPEVYGPGLRSLVGTPPTAAYRAALDGADGEERLDSCLIADQTYHLPGGLLVKADPRARERLECEYYSSPKPSSSRRRAGGSVKWMPWMPRAVAASAFFGLSSM